jgi:hypothetical protein
MSTDDIRECLAEMDEAGHQVGTQFDQEVGR